MTNILFIELQYQKSEIRFKNNNNTKHMVNKNNKHFFVYRKLCIITKFKQVEQKQ